MPINRLKRGAGILNVFAQRDPGTFLMECELGGIFVTICARSSSLRDGDFLNSKHLHDVRRRVPPTHQT